MNDLKLELRSVIQFLTKTMLLLPYMVKIVHAGRCSLNGADNQFQMKLKVEARIEENEVEELVWNRLMNEMGTY